MEELTKIWDPLNAWGDEVGKLLNKPTTSEQLLTLRRLLAEARVHTRVLIGWVGYGYHTKTQIQEDYDLVMWEEGVEIVGAGVPEEKKERKYRSCIKRKRTKNPKGPKNGG